MSQTNMFDQKRTCPKCQGTVFRIKGMYLSTDNNYPHLVLECANYKCKQEQIRTEEMFFEVIEKGLRCDKCNTYSVSRDWNKNKRVYISDCYHCGNHEEDPE